MCCCIRSQRGQATVEAAFLLPVFFVLLGLVLQPAILLYDRCVMNAAAAEGCRMLETRTADEASARAFMLRRLSAVPDADVFHHGGSGGWEVELEGGDGAGPVSVRVVNRARPLPLFGVLAGLAGSREGDYVKQEVVLSSSLWPQWAQEAGRGPSELTGAWT